MTTYTVTVNIDQYWVDNFNAGNYALIMAKAVGSSSDGTPTYNVVAQTYGENGNVMLKMIVQWTDEYQISATAEVFSDGANVNIEGLSKALDAPFGTEYHLKSWTDASVETNPKAPVDGWLFRNNIGASSVVSLKINGSYTPIYISGTTLPPGTQILTPIPSVCFWFSTQTQTSAMVTIDTSNTGFVNLSGGTTASITYNKKGQWVNDNKAVDYTKVSAEKK